MLRKKELLTQVLIEARLPVTAGAANGALGFRTAAFALGWNFAGRTIFAVVSSFLPDWFFPFFQLTKHPLAQFLILGVWAYIL